MHIYVAHLTMPISVARKKVLSVTFLFTIETTGTSVPVFISTIPFSDCLKDKMEHIQLFCAVLCTTFVCSVMLTLTHSYIWAVLTGDSWVILVFLWVFASLFTLANFLVLWLVFCYYFFVYFVSAHWANLVLRCTDGWSSLHRQTISLCNQPPSRLSLAIPSG